MGLKKTQLNTAAKFGVPKYKIVDYATQEEFEDYISSPDYKIGSNKGVCFGYEHFTEDEENEVANNYTLNVHYPDKRIGLSALSYAQAIPDQTNAVWLPYTAAPDVKSYLRYQHQGFSFFQNLVAIQALQFALDDITPLISFIFQPMQTETSVYDPFSVALSSLLPLFLLITYIPPVYNMTFKIVREKESRTKETMRIMGMTDLPYWLSWLVFYTVINTLVSTLAWGTLMFKVINYSVPFYLWIFFWLYG